MKKIITLIFSVSITISVLGQTNTFPTDGNVGIGLSNPTAKLHLRGTGGWDSAIKIDDLNGRNFSIYSVGNKFYINDETSYKNRIILNETGYVGIGIANPLNLFHIENGDLRITNDMGTGGDGKASIIFSEISNLTDAHARITYHGDDFSGDDNYIGFGLGNNVSKDINQMVIKRSGRVGIGTTNPQTNLEVFGSAGLRLSGSSHNDDYMIIKGSHNVADLNPGGTAAASLITNRYLGHLVLDINANDPHDAFAIRTDKDLNGEVDHIAVVVKPNGNMGIGTTTPDYKLDVVGTIRARELKVDMQGADFVFEDDYQLRSLEDVQEFITTNKHLPDVAPAKEMKENGVNQSEMNQLLLRKVEELTLYVIEQQKEIVRLKAKEERIDQLEAAIQTLMNQNNASK